VKEYLSQKGITYVERDVTQDERAVDELAALNAFTTPVVKVGEEVVIGFDRRKLDTLLADESG
jgi:glutaredoxin 3